MKTLQIQPVASWNVLKGVLDASGGGGGGAGWVAGGGVWGGVGPVVGGSVRSVAGSVFPPCNLVVWVGLTRAVSPSFSSKGK